MGKENSMNDFGNLCSEVSPGDFEKLCLELLQNLDGFIEYIVMGVKMKAVVECKRHRNPIKREVVLVVHNKMISIGANKGIYR